MEKKKYELDYEELIEVNGDKQNIRVRGTDENNPVLLFLHGGPGVCGRHLTLQYNSPLAQYCTIVCWDQRGAGKSYKGKTELKADMFVEDARVVVEYLCKKFGKEKIYVAGHSWGSMIGVLLVQRYPERIAAYIGIGQLIDGYENERLSHEFCLKEAEKLGDKKAVARLKEIVPEKGRYKTHDDMMFERDCLTRYGGADYMHRDGIIKSFLIPLIKTPEYKLSQLPAYYNGAMYSTEVLWDEVIECHFLETVPSLSVPVFITQGRHDYNTPFAIAKEWFDKLDAPEKQWFWFENSAHSPVFEEADKWNEIIAQKVFGAKQ